MRGETIVRERQSRVRAKSDMQHRLGIVQRLPAATDGMSRQRVLHAMM
jgi:hypothetical protein